MLLAEAGAAAGSELRDGLAGILRHHDIAVDESTPDALDLLDWEPRRRWLGGVVRLDFGRHGGLWRCLAGGGMPLVAVNARGDEPLLCDLVGIDNRRLGAQVAEALVAAGHRRLLVVGFPGLPIFCERVDGFCAAAARLGAQAERHDTAWNTLVPPGEEQRLRERAAALAGAGGGAVWGVHGVMTAQLIELDARIPLGAGVVVAHGRNAPGVVPPGQVAVPAESLHRVGRIIGLRLLARLSGDISPPARHSVAPISVG